MAIGQEQALNNKKKAIAAGVMLVLAAGGLYWSYASAHPFSTSRAAKSVWYYDLDKKKLFSGPMAAVPLATSPWGEQGVRAHVFSCGRCDSQQDSDRWIGYLERVPAELAKESADLYRAGPTAPPDLARVNELTAKLMEGTQVGPPDAGPDSWVAASSPEAAALKVEQQSKCEGHPAIECVYASK